MPPMPSSEILLANLRDRAPDLFDLIDSEKIRVRQSRIPDVPMDFEPSHSGGRGDSYRTAQEDPTIRLVGIRELLTLASPGFDLSRCSSNDVFLDVLGGDGTIARAVPYAVPTGYRPTVLTSDVSAGMVAAAQRYGLPAIREAAQALLLRDCSVGAVILAYGTHHIPFAERDVAVREAHRVTRPGGRIVLHDFELDSPVARWFSDVVDRYSRTGHRFPHFSRAEMAHLLGAAGYRDIEVRRMYDPFVVTGSSPDDALLKLGSHLMDMYGLVRLRDLHKPSDAARIVADLADVYFRYDGLPAAVDQIEVRPAHPGEPPPYRVELPRVALVATGTRRSL